MKGHAARLRLPSCIGWIVLKIVHIVKGAAG